MKKHTHLMLLLFGLVALSPAYGGENKIPNASFEQTKKEDKMGNVFTEWNWYVQDGDATIEASDFSHSGKLSCLISSKTDCRARLQVRPINLEKGKYRFSFYLRGLDVQKGTFNTDVQLFFTGKFTTLNTTGTFGWKKISFVYDVKQSGEIQGPWISLFGPGIIWVDDVMLEKVADDIPASVKPEIGEEEAPIKPKGELDVNKVVSCPRCQYRNMPEWGKCYACGQPLETKIEEFTGPTIRIVESFEGPRKLRGNGTVVTEHATEGQKALRLEKDYIDMRGKNGSINWKGYDYLKVDFFTESEKPQKILIEIQDSKSRGFWGRVNYNTVIPGGKSTLTVPMAALFIGEKSRPGRLIETNDITRFVINVGNPDKPIYIDNVRIERDQEMKKKSFPGLYAWDFGKGSSPLMEGFTRFTMATVYSPGRGFGFHKARIWRCFDALQPDPLYQDFICIKSGEVRVDVPNGKYRVFINIDSPSGFWGEIQTYKNRQIKAEGKLVVDENMDIESFKKKYYRFWNIDDKPSENTFDKYSPEFFKEKKFDVEVTDGQLNIEFKGMCWEHCLSAMVVFPLTKEKEGEEFLNFVKERRRFYFDNSFKRTLHIATGDTFEPTAIEKKQGFAIFRRPNMDEVYYNDTPRKNERITELNASAFLGEWEPLQFSLIPTKDLGNVTVSISDLTGPGTIPSSAVKPGYVSNRIGRVSMDGSVYTIKPTWVLPLNSVDMPNGTTRRFWLRMRVPDNAAPGNYTGNITIASEKGGTVELPVKFTVYKGKLDKVDMASGPYGVGIKFPWSSKEAAEVSRKLTEESMKTLYDHGFTTFTVPPITMDRRAKEIKLDFTTPDWIMAKAREIGFENELYFSSPIANLSFFHIQKATAQIQGYNDYGAYIKALHTKIYEHAKEKNWLPYITQVGTEPTSGPAMQKAIENIKYHKNAFPDGPPYFTLSTSLYEKQRNKHESLEILKYCHMAMLCLHDQYAVDEIKKLGLKKWSFYNCGSRWTHGIYMYKLVKEGGMTMRNSWHWNATAGDPYYPLDCREDDYAWCNSSPDMTLVPSLHFERVTEGNDDYRLMLTLSRLAESKKGTPESDSAQKLIADMLATFKIGDRNFDIKQSRSFWDGYRKKLIEAIVSLQ